MKYSLNDICRHIGAHLQGDGETVICGVNALEMAGSSEITFAEGERYLEQVSAGSASACIVGDDFPELPGRNLLRVAEPRRAFVRVMELFVPAPEPGGIHPEASIAGSAELGEAVSVGACAVVSRDARIGARTLLEPGSYVGPGVEVGEDCRIEANASLMQGVRIGDRVVIHAGATIGGEGFGFVWVGDHHHKIPQLGGVQIDDDVEIGCNSCVDRATLGVTRIRRGTKIDNQVQIGHNNDIGEDVILVSQVGISGSVKVGDRAMLGGQAGVADHLKIGAGARVGAATGVTRDVAPGEAVWGTPSRPMKRVLQELAHLARLPKLMKKIRAGEKAQDALQARVVELEQRLSARKE